MAIGFSDRGGTRSTAIILGLLFVLALVLRIAFNVGVAYDDEADRYLYSGNDPWYHDRAVEHIVETGETLTTDPAINYPNGGRNPNPPIFDWTTALDAKVLESTGASDPVGLALNLSVGFWGALTIIPVFMIGKALFGRNAGLWGAFFMAVSAPHIQRTVFGFADHDATTMFFITLAMAFMVLGLQAMKRKEYVDDWRSGALDDIRRALSENKVTLLYSALAGVSVAATALTWKGYPYVLGVLAIAFGLQLLVDHARNKDSTVLTFAFLIPVILAYLIAWPYYSDLNLGRSTLTPHLYVIIGMLVAAVVLVPTRDLPSIVVFPATVLAAALGLLALWLIVPSTAELIFTGLGYFRQTKLYSTIAEAQRTELGFIAANFGFFMFLVAFWAFGRAVKKGWKGDAPMMLMASWALIAGFMAFAASRFVMNAAPVFAVLGGAATSWILIRAGFNEVARRRRQLHGQGNPIMNGMRALTGRSIAVGLVVVVLLVMPNLWLGVDAATSADFERENDLDTPRLGAFGIGFDLKQSGWLELFDHLATLDTNVPLEDRPGFIAWWDYGHWATAIGKHPTVADPFQNHFEIAGRFLASESEEEATLWLSILLADAGLRTESRNAVEAVFEEHDIDAAEYDGDYDKRYAAVDHLTGDDVFTLYKDMREATGKSVGYLGVDSRMFPVSQFNSGIFYAPVFLANKNPDEFLQVTYVGQDGGQTLEIELQQYAVDKNGDSYRLPEARFVDQNGDRWVVVGNEAFRGTEIPLGGATATQSVQVQARFQPTERFEDAMYTRAFGSIDASIPAGEGLTHWKVIFQDVQNNNGVDVRTTALLEYFDGHRVSGTVVDGNGDPMVGVDVTFADEIGATHDAAATDENGAFSVLAPHGQLNLTIVDSGSVIYEQPWNQPRDQDGGSTDGVEVQLPLANVEGIIYRDLDGDGAYDPDNDEPLDGAVVAVGDGIASTTTGNDGRYSMAGVPAGSYSITAAADGYETGGTFEALVGGETTEADIIMAAAASDVTVTITENGDPQAGVPVRFQGPDDEFVTTTANGTGLVTLQPGEYTVVVDYTFTRDGVEVVYDERRTVTVPFGGEDFAFTVEV